MTVHVGSSLESAIIKLRRQRLVDGVEREVKIHQIPKPSAKKAFKKFLAERRRQKSLRKRDRYSEAQERRK